MANYTLDPEFRYKEYIGRSRDFYVEQVSNGNLSGERLEATKAIANALTVAFDAAPDDPVLEE